MGIGSVFSRLRKVLEKPEAPAYIQQQEYGEVPWYTRVLEALRPPSAVPTGRVPLNPQQRRMILITLALVVAAASIWAGVSYVAGAPERARAAYEEGMRLIGPNDFSGAVAKFTDSISIRESADAYLARGNAYFNLAQPDKALADWGRAIEIDSGLAAAYTARATYYRLAGENDKALPDLNQSLQLDPTVDGYFQRGQVHAALGDHVAAIADYDRAIVERREAPYVYLARSIAKRAIGDEEGYRQDQQTAAKLQGIR